MYYKYTTVENKVILCTDDFSYGVSVISTEHLENIMISIGREEAHYNREMYQSALADIEQQYIDDPEGKAAAIQEVANTLKQGLLDKGYVLGKDIEVIIHE